MTSFEALSQTGSHYQGLHHKQVFYHVYLGADPTPTYRISVLNDKNLMRSHII